jgi:transcription antitermination factor NusG
VHLLSVSPAPRKSAFSPDASVAASPSSWYCLTVRSRFDFVVRDLLQAEGIEEFCPTWEEHVKWSDRTSTTVRPLFPGYIFARFSPADVAVIRQIRGVVQILSNNQIPVSIPDHELADLRAVIESPVPDVCRSYVAGTRATVQRGPYAGASGVISRIKHGTLLTLMLPFFGRDTPVEIESADCKASDAPKAKK